MQIWMRFRWRVGMKWPGLNKVQRIYLVCQNFYKFWLKNIVNILFCTTQKFNLTIHTLKQIQKTSMVYKAKFSRNIFLVKFLELKITFYLIFISLYLVQTYSKNIFYRVIKLLMCINIISMNYPSSFYQSQNLG